LYGRTFAAGHNPITLVVRRPPDPVSTWALPAQRAGHRELLPVAAGDGELHPADLRPALEPHPGCERRPCNAVDARGRADRRRGRPRGHGARLPVWRKSGYAGGRHADAAQSAPEHSGATGRERIAARLIAGRGGQPPTRRWVAYHTIHR